VLEDHADLAEGLLALHAVTGTAAYAAAATRLLDVVLDEFADGDGGFFDTATRSTDAALETVGRPQDPTDAATPSGWSAAAGALLTAAALTGSARLREAAGAALAVPTAVAARAPRFAGWALAVAQAWVRGPREVAVVGPAADEATVRLHRVALAGTAPGLVVAVGAPQADGVELLHDRGLVDGRPAAYVCHGFVCEAPTTEPGALAAAVGAHASVWRAAGTPGVPG
jgi:uncharacterized protein YyaL (SSP411 family)